jgi:glutaredoxin
MAKDYLKKQGVEFEDVNVAADQEAAKEMVEKSKQMGVPVIDIDGEIFVGFDKQGMEKVLKEKGLIQ